MPVETTALRMVCEALEIPEDLADQIRRVLVQDSQRLHAGLVQEGASVRVETYVEGGPPIIVLNWAPLDAACACAIALAHTLDCEYRYDGSAQ